MAILTYKPKLFICTCCGEAKPESEYYRQSYTGARTNECKTCINVKRSVQRNKAKHGKFVSKEKQRSMGTVEYDLKDWKDVMVYFHGSCAFCGKPEGRAKADKLDRDHLIPCSKGGKTTRDNVIPACRKCNRGRGNADFEEWFRKQEFFSVERLVKIKQWVASNKS